MHKRHLQVVVSTQRAKVACAYYKLNRKLYLQVIRLQPSILKLSPQKMADRIVQKLRRPVYMEPVKINLSNISSNTTKISTDPPEQPTKIMGNR